MAEKKKENNFEIEKKEITKYINDKKIIKIEKKKCLEFVI